VPEARERPLTAAEITEARAVFGDSIHYPAVRVVNGRYVPWQLSSYVVTPDQRLFWPGAPADLVTADGGRHRGRFIHEMTHVMQHQHGLWLRLRAGWLQFCHFATGRLYDPYRYRCEPGKPFSAYNLEQQAELAVAIWCGRQPNIIDYGRCPMPVDSATGVDPGSRTA
jgi:hypothetical protein